MQNRHIEYDSTHPIALSGEWAGLLSDTRDIAEHIESCATDYEIDVEFVDECFRDMGIAGAVLKWVAIEDIRAGNENANIPCEEKERAYAKLPPETMPPIVLLDGEVQDGNHRYRVSVANGATGMWAYVALDEDELQIEIDRTMQPSPTRSPLRRPL